jgi:hypothetical protein
MAKFNSHLTSLTMRDLERCWQIQEALDAADDAVKSINWPGKQAVRQLLKLAYENSIEIMRKGSAGALRRYQEGKFADHHHTREFVDRLISLAPQFQPASDDAPSPLSDSSADEPIQVRGDST